MHFRQLLHARASDHVQILYEASHDYCAPVEVNFVPPNDSFAETSPAVLPGSSLPACPRPRHPNALSQSSQQILPKSNTKSSTHIRIMTGYLQRRKVKPSRTNSLMESIVDQRHPRPTGFTPSQRSQTKTREMNTLRKG